jgi:alpha-L-rhamnosidase
VDCPAYEQTYWVGDSRNEALVGYYVFGGEEIVKRCLRLVPGSKFQSLLYSDRVPSGWSSVIPNWTFFWVVACTEHYLRTGDLSLAREMWPHVRYTLDRYLEYLDDHGLLSIRAWNLLDWAPMDQPGTGVVTHQNAFLVRALRAATELADVVGDSAQSAAYAASAQRLKAAINDHLWSEERRAYLDAIHADKRRSDTFSMQTQVVAYLSDVAEEERAARIEGYLADPPSDFVRIGSPFMSFFHYEALTKVGKPEMMLDDIRENYGRMVEPNGYAEVNGLNIYYERHGDGLPLVLLHGAFGTIESCFAGLLPELARYGRQDPHDNGPERIPERRDSRRALGRLAERIRAP